MGEVTMGSPPRVRGKETDGGLRRRKSRITPACAGKSEYFSCQVVPCQDHPRVCGEKWMLTALVTASQGSPPRMRGKDSVCNESAPLVGITPAYAGKSFSTPWGGGKMGDHPRVCGEKHYPRKKHLSRIGSPPRVRGKAQKVAVIWLCAGITPACAGKRLKRSHSIGHFSYILCLFHSVLHRASVSGGSRAGPCAPPCLPAQNTVPV